ncbi:Uncharacterised protein [Mycobacteroides abscessus]|nr:Uncharacterised protein [Mycobacteroides abscessus]
MVSSPEPPDEQAVSASVVVSAAARRMLRRISGHSKRVVMGGPLRRWHRRRTLMGMTVEREVAQVQVVAVTFMQRFAGRRPAPTRLLRSTGPRASAQGIAARRPDDQDEEVRCPLRCPMCVPVSVISPPRQASPRRRSRASSTGSPASRARPARRCSPRSTCWATSDRRRCAPAPPASSASSSRS